MDRKEKLTVWLKETGVSGARVTKEANLEASYISMLNRNRIQHPSQSRVKAIIQTINEFRQKKDLPPISPENVIEFAQAKDDSDKVPGEPYKEVRNRRKRRNRALNSKRPRSYKKPYWRSSPAHFAAYRLLRLFSPVVKLKAANVEVQDNQVMQNAKKRRRNKTTARLYLNTALGLIGNKNSPALGFDVPKSLVTNGFTLALKSEATEVHDIVSTFENKLPEEIKGYLRVEFNEGQRQQGSKEYFTLVLGKVVESDNFNPNSTKLLPELEQRLSQNEIIQLHLLLTKYLAERLED